MSLVWSFLANDRLCSSLFGDGASASIASSLQRQRQRRRSGAEEQVARYSPQELRKH